MPYHIGPSCGQGQFVSQSFKDYWHGNAATAQEVAYPLMHFGFHALYDANDIFYLVWTASCGALPVILFWTV